MHVTNLPDQNDRWLISYLLDPTIPDIVSRDDMSQHYASHVALPWQTTPRGVATSVGRILRRVYPGFREIRKGKRYRYLGTLDDRRAMLVQHYGAGTVDAVLQCAA